MPTALLKLEGPGPMGSNLALALCSRGVDLLEGAQCCQRKGPAQESRCHNAGRNPQFAVAQPVAC